MEHTLSFLLFTVLGMIAANKSARAIIKDMILTQWHLIKPDK
ncbi:Uncharacterised protein [Klebsiella quasipneumoniae]|jgi:hypothetical protein|nr:Uncharacterised protein [Klebsiella quasipneumoniae]VGP60341.1 hypothetical protein SB00098_01534 [Klebsiella quasipneumoniae subsp. quasipneumoniae]SLU09468.1 Uncharacterised protein [Klebsiella quasipneumoniae]SLU24677.1 Uncharacterised protein [Klebsiella quasipneumoniae]SLU31071.1 Uncharacterised protein [Klebsiella quasipneumoniae]